MVEKAGLGFHFKLDVIERCKNCISTPFSEERKDTSNLLEIHTFTKMTNDSKCSNYSMTS